MILVRGSVLDLDVFEEFLGQKAEISAKTLRKIFEPESIRQLIFMVDTGATVSFIPEDRIYGLYYEYTRMRVVRTASGFAIYPEIRIPICVKVDDKYKCAVTEALLLPLNLNRILAKNKKLERDFANILDQLESEGFIDDRKSFMDELKEDYEETRSGFVEADALLGLKTLKDISVSKLIPL